MKNFIVYTLVLILCAGAGIGIFCAWPAITGTINKSKYYTSKDVQNAYDQGYNDGITNETELTAKNEYLQSLVDKYYVDVQDLNGQVKTLTNSNTQLSNSLDVVTCERDNALTNVNSLTQQVASNNQTIADNEQTISTMQARINTLQASSEDKSNEIATLRNQISSLQTTNQNLQTANDNNLNTITILNTQIASLNSSITTLTEQIQNNSNVASGLNNKIAQLEQTIAYYEQYIQQLENENQVVATFEFNGSVYNVQIIAKNSKVSVVSPTNTDYVIFNGWQVNGEDVDLNNYTLTTNTKFVADVTYKHKVQFMVDNNVVDSKFVVSNTNTTAASQAKDGYEFDGWTINGVDIVDLTNYVITQDTTFIAKFTKLHSVTFMYEGDNVSTQTIRNGEYATAVSVDNTAYKAFNGWLVNGTSVDLVTYKIVGDVVFVADIIYSYDVIFKNEDVVVDSKIVQDGEFVTTPTAPIKDGFIFAGWSLDGENIVDPTTNAVTANVIYIAVFQVGYGLFDADTGAMTMSWQELKDNDYISVNTSGWLYGGSRKSELIGVLRISDEVVVIGQSAFSECSLLTDIIIPNSVHGLQNNAFSLCSGLTSIIIPDSVTYIYYNAFGYCSSLSSITLSQNLNTLEYLAFQSCISLESIVLPSSLSKIDYRTFQNCSCLVNVVIPSSVTIIGYQAFGGCTSLEHIFIPNSVISTTKTGSMSSGGSLFDKCSSSLLVYCEAVSQPSGWNTNWNYVNSKRLTVKWGYTYEQYCEEVGIAATNLTTASAAEIMQTTITTAIVPTRKYSIIAA